jgi:Ca2+-binding RTX toxin-like protein
LLWGSSADDQIAGGFGNDSLFGSAGNDVLTGNEGNDTLDGGEGADVYAFNVGDGVDRILDTGGFDTDGISFGAGITPDMLTLGLGSLLIISGRAAIPFISILIRRCARATSSKPVRRRDDADLSTAPRSRLRYHGTDGDDILSGTSVNDRIRGLGGDDTLTAGRARTCRWRKRATPISRARLGEDLGGSRHPGQ